MKEDDYLKNRVDDQIEWYCNKAKINKSFHHWSRGAVIVFSAAIPLISGLEIAGHWDNIIQGVLGCLITIIVGLSGLFKFQEKWSEYRTASETLKRDKWLYQSKVAPYDDETDSFRVLVTNVEGVLSNEIDTWKKYMREHKESEHVNKQIQQFYEQPVGKKSHELPLSPKSNIAQTTDVSES